MSNDGEVVLWLVGLLAGSMLFFAATVAPTVFRVLPAEQAGVFLRAFFPKYYLWGMLIALIATMVALASHWPLGLACAIVTALFAYARQRLMPQINRARDAELRGEPDADKRFKALHLRSVVINGFQLVVLIGATSYLIWGV